MTPPKTLAILPLCGIGDLIQHLGCLRAIAERSLHGKVTILIKKRSMAKEWIDEEPWIETVDYLERKDLYKQAFHLRKKHFEEVWVLHRSFSHALMARIASIPRRFGPGHTFQTLCLTNPALPQNTESLSHLDLNLALLKQQGLSLKLEHQRLPLKKGSLEKISQAYGSLPYPLVTFGIGASELFKKWSLNSFLEIGQYLSSHLPVTILLSGDAGDHHEIERLGNRLREKNIPVIMATQWSIAETFALLSHTHLYIGNDTSLLNASAALGIPSVGLFGATPILDFSPSIWPVYPFTHTKESIEGMIAIKPQHVIEVLEKYNWLNVLKRSESA